MDKSEELERIFITTAGIHFPVDEVKHISQLAPNEYRIILNSEEEILITDEDIYHFHRITKKPLCVDIDVNHLIKPNFFNYCSPKKLL